MSDLPQIVIHQKKVDAIQRFHPWIFSGAIKRQDAGITEGMMVEVYSEAGQFLALGYFLSGSIAVKILSFQPVTTLRQLIFDRLRAAYALRETLGLTQNSVTNCYRLVNSEGDQLPGLILDWYNGTIVLQAHAIGIYQHREVIVAGLEAIYGGQLQAVYDKSATTLGKKSSLQTTDGYLYGVRSEPSVLEYGHAFIVDWEAGQKTGFFLDQRENRRQLAQFVVDKKVLNTFSYSGGFSIYAIAAGARCVHSVDSSAKAIAELEANLQLNPAPKAHHQSFTQDVFSFFRECDDDYDVVVLDPPAFAKSLSARHQAMQAYKRLNLQALTKLKPGGILFTFSCSQVVGVEHFTGAVTAAAIAAGRHTRILHQLTQPADHPTSIYHPEGRYLKGLVLAVE